MRVLLSTIGSRGDVQPLVALALALKALGQEVRLCVPPDFREWIEGLGLPVTPIGPEVRKAAASLPATPASLSPEQLHRMREATVAAQFETIAAAARNCEVLVGATALQIAAPSVAERMGIPYVFAAYCPAVLPSPHHAPPPLGMPGHRRSQPAGAVQTSRGRRPPRRRGNHHRGRASRRAPGRHPPDLRPALLGPTHPPPRHRNRPRARPTDRRLADQRSRAHPSARRGGPSPIHRHRGAR
jgi:UDP:flavonoid glycosyltransferase YjiC (YdhE family)